MYDAFNKIGLDESLLRMTGKYTIRQLVDPCKKVDHLGCNTRSRRAYSYKGDKISYGRLAICLQRN